MILERLPPGQAATSIIPSATDGGGLTDTAAVTVNENADPNIGDDLVTALHRLIPEGVWQHDLIDDNGSAHIKASMIGASEILPVRDGKLVLGTWQAVMLVEFDGPRERQLVVTVR